MLAAAMSFSRRNATPGRSGTRCNGDLRLVAVERDTRDERLLHTFLLLGHDHRPRAVVERGQHPERHPVLACELHRPDLEHLRAEARELEHLLERQAGEPPRIGLDPGIGGIHPVDVGIDPAFVRPEGDGERHPRRVRASPTEGGDAARLVDPLESGDDDHPPGVESGPEPGRVDVQDPGPVERRIGADGNLGAGIGTGRAPAGFEGHGHEPDGRLLAAREEGIELPAAGRMTNGGREIQQPIRLPGHGRNHHRDLVPGRPRPRDAVRHRADPLDRRDGRPAVLVHQQGHETTNPRLTPAAARTLPARPAAAISRGRRAVPGPRPRPTRARAPGSRGRSPRPAPCPASPRPCRRPGRQRS